MDARFVGGLDGASMREDARPAEAGRAAAVIVRAGPFGEPVVLAAGLSTTLRRPLLGACGPPVDDALAGALALGRAMGREGHAVSEGPAFPVPGARHRPRPPGPASPVVALEVRSGAGADADVVSGAVAARADDVLRPPDPARCRMGPL